MTFLEVPGARLHVQTLGNGPRTVVLAHGLFANIALWYFSLAPALAREHRVVLYDLRGHGLSSRPERGYGLQTMRDDLAAVIAATSDEPVSLVGFSYGAAIAARYACDHPDRVEALVLVEPPLPMTLASLETWLGSLTSAAELIDGLPAAPRVAVRGGRRPGRLVRGSLDLVSSTSLRSDLADEPDISNDDLRAIRAATLVCYGLDSPIAHAGTRDRLEALLPAALHTALPGGHFLPKDSPEQLTATITSFLAQLTTERAP
jgi:esterase